MSLISFPAVISGAANGQFRLTHSRFGGVSAYEHPQLLYHVQVVRGEELVPRTGTSFPAFVDALPDWGPRLSAIYGIPDPTIHFIPRECSPHLDGPQACEGNLSQIPTRFNGRSWNLAAAVGVAAAMLGVRVPGWVCSSGCLLSNQCFHPNLGLVMTGSYDRKIRLCGGLPPDYAADSQGQWFCQAPPDCDMHGEGSYRGLPGQIRLLLLARWEPDGDERNGLSRQTRRELQLVSRPDLVATLAADGLPTVAASLAVDRMLVLMIPTVWHTLKILDLQVDRFPTDIRITQADITAFLAAPAMILTGYAGWQSFARDGPEDVTSADALNGPCGKIVCSTVSAGGNGKPRDRRESRRFPAMARLLERVRPGEGPEDGKLVK